LQLCCAVRSCWQGSPTIDEVMGKVVPQFTLSGL